MKFYFTGQMFVVNQDISPNIKNSEYSEFAFHIWKAQNQYIYTILAY